MSSRKKLIEVALPLEAINEEAALRKRKAPAGYPTTLHKWWAQRPLAACRAVLFASLVDDPSSRPDDFPSEEAQKAERERLFRIIEALVKWENSGNEQVLGLARKEIHKATGGDPPIVLDPFCGGGSIPLEAQRLGLIVRASDLNPVAVLITKGLIEIPPKFDGLPPVNPESVQRLTDASWLGPNGLAEDVRFYGGWLREEAHQRIGHLYPKVTLPKEQGGAEATVVAWLWARSVNCPNPACGGRMPLVRSFWLSSKKGAEAWVEPVVDRKAKSVSFQVRTVPTARPDRTKISAGTAFVGDSGKKSQATFVCIICGDGIAKGDYIDAQATAGLMTAVPLACAVQGARQRIYCDFDDGMVARIESSLSSWKQDEVWLSQLPSQASRGTFASNAQGRRYGFKTFADYFTTRQLVALTTFTDLISEARRRAFDDAVVAGLADDGLGLAAGGRGAHAYADAVAVYLALAASRLADYGSALSSWRPKDNAMRSVFSMQAVQMSWDFAEGNPFGKSSSGFAECVEVVAKCVSMLPRSMPAGSASQLDAASAVAAEGLVCTDPPYYANVSYAELSDFFYIWLRRTLGKLFPDLFSTLLTPKDQEIIASPYRFGGDKGAADQFFEHGLASAFRLIHEAQPEEYPLTVFYALKQAEGEVVEGDNVIAALVSTGWEKMLEGLIAAKLTIQGTWPMRTEGDNRQVGLGANALASSIVLVCRPRPADAPLGTRAEFVRALKSELPAAVKKLQQGNIAPVDLAQAAIGPGMAVFSRFAKVLEADGSSLRVRTALGLINQLLDEALTEQESEYDPATRWALAWFEQHGMDEGRYGDAETLSKAKNVAVGGLVEDGFLWSRKGKVRLLTRDELDGKWDPRLDQRLTVWEVSQHLVRLLDKEGEPAAAGLLRKLGSVGEVARDLAYRLYSTSERKGWVRDAVAYNSLVVAWPQIARLAANSAEPLLEQTNLLTEVSVSGTE